MNYCTVLDSTAFTDASLLLASNLGRLRITMTLNGNSTGKNSSDQCNELYSFGAHSFTIWNAATGEVAFDSGDGVERKISEVASKAGFDFFFSDGHDDLIHLVDCL